MSDRRATIVSVQLRAGLSYVALEAPISYVHGRAVAYVNDAGLLQFPRETVVAADTVALRADYVRAYSDEATTSETFSWLLSRPVADTVSITDALEAVLGRDLADSITATDDGPSFAIGLSLNDSVTATDGLVVSLQYFLTGDGVTVTDTLEPLLAIGLTPDTAGVSDTPAFSVGKSLAETINASDAPVIAVGLTKGDTVSTSDSIVTEFTFGVLPTDTVATSENFQYTSTRVTTSVLNGNTLGKFGLNV